MFHTDSGVNLTFHTDSGVNVMFIGVMILAFLGLDSRGAVCG